MKLATYFKGKGDYVRFFKGNLNELIADLYSEKLIYTFKDIEPDIQWEQYKEQICTYIRKGFSADYSKLLNYGKPFGPSIGNWLKYYRKKFRTGNIDDVAKFDCICVSTLFTFYYKITIDTINFCKKLVKRKGVLYVGGVMASVVPDEIERDTKIKPIKGLLDKPGIIDSEDLTIIDDLCPDYSILEEIDYVYPENNGYYAHMTRGCVRKCQFCAVPIIEPVFKHYLPLKEKLDRVNTIYGERKNLLLFDNNTLASKQFPQIIEEIKECGFIKGATYREPNFLELAVDNLKNNVNEYAYRRLANKILNLFVKKLAGQTKEQYLKDLESCGITENYLPSKEQIQKVYPLIKDLYEKRRSKHPKKRFVDFNQGVDARLLTEKKMELLSQTPVRPLRIAFDSMKDAKVYEQAIRLAKKYNIEHLSNYLLFNYKDRPVELYRRLKLNVELCEELDLKIYSFPMRYSPIWDENDLHHNRKFVGKFWNKKFIRSIQCVLNATKGKVGRKKEFFEAAFGMDEKQYFEILWMPENYILNRNKALQTGLIAAWKELYYSMTPTELDDFSTIVQSNEIDGNKCNSFSAKIKIALGHYLISRDDIIKKSENVERIICESNPTNLKHAI